MKLPKKYAKYEWIKNEITTLIAIYIGLIIILRLIFSDDNLGYIITLVSTIYYTMMLPGYSIMLLLKEKIELTERILLSGLVGMLTTGTLSYYLGLIGWKVAGQIIMPLIVIIIPIGYLAWKKNKENTQKTEEK